MAVGDWVPCLNYGVQTELDIIVPNLLGLDNVLVGVGPATIGSLGDIATVETEDEVMTKRVVGDIVFRGALLQDHSLLIHERIRVGLRDDGGVMSFFANDFQEASQANEPFLWERVQTFEAEANVAFMWPAGPLSHPGYSHVDVRVARRLSREQVLVYSVQVLSITAAPFDVEDVIYVFPFLRTWARALS